MLNVMIVDDEFYFREALKISIPWKELGFSICGEAKNGKDALEKVWILNPDIIIVDINMPIMDGLEFVQNIREAGINSKIIILTGYSEFNYARKTIQLGVNNYILKPVNEEELTNSMLEIKKVIENEANIKIEIDSYKKQLKESLPLLKDKFLNELIQGNLIKREPEALKKMEYLNINASLDYYLVVTIELDYEEKFHWDDEDTQLWKFAVTNISNEILKKQFVYDMCCDINNRVCIIIGRKVLLDNSDFNLLLENSLELIRAVVNKHLSFSITIGVGSRKNELFDIAESYKEAIVALKNKLTIGNNKVIFYDSISEAGIKGNFFTVEHRSQLLLNLRTANGKEVQNIISRIFEKMRKENTHYELLFVACTEMISVCLEFIVEVGLSFKDVLPDSRLNIIEEIQSKRSIDEMEDWIGRIYRRTLDCVQRNKSSKPSKLIEEVKRFINENYQNYELSIDEIAKSLFINYAHLCYIFKRDAGTTINEYLTEFRIKKAKELLDSGNSLVLHVASRVGYADANYFGKCFKKYYGLSPSKYLENIRR